jgi:hypothetical protein
LNFAGASGRIASAGGSRTAMRTAPITPMNAAPALTKNATPIFGQSGMNSSEGKRKNCWKIATNPRPRNNPATVPNETAATTITSAYFM